MLSCAAAVELEAAVANGIAVQRASLNEIAADLSTAPGPDLHTVRDKLRARITYVHFSTFGMTVVPETALRYIPVSGDPEYLPPVFDRADRLEFQQQDYAAAMRLLTPLAASADANIQAAALMRLGRMERRNGHISEALGSYQKLSGLSGQKIGAVPADWLGLYARCTIYAAENKTPELGVTLDQLVHVLTTGGYRVSETTYHFYVDAAVRWAELVGRAGAAQSLSQPHAASELAAEFYDLWADWRQGAAASSGMQTAGTDHGFLFGLWTTFESDLLVGIVPFDVLYSTSMAAVTDDLEKPGIGWRISDETGRIFSPQT